MSEKVFFTNATGQKICGILEEPNKKFKHIVIIIHGSATSKDGSVRFIAQELTNIGVNSLRLDLDGCGESEGTFEEQTISSTVLDVEASIEFVKKRGYSKIDLFGSSRGGLTAMATALKHPEINKMALRAPVSDYVSLYQEKLGKEGLQKWKEQGYLDKYEEGVRINYQFFEDVKNYIMYDKVKFIKCPTLIIHGNVDVEVNLEQSKRVIKGFQKGILLIMPGAGHGLDVNGDKTEGNKLFSYWFKNGKIPQEYTKWITHVQ